MTLSEFTQKYNYKAVDFDGAYGAQCVDLVQFYNRDVVGGGRFSGNAKDIFGQRSDKYTWVRNSLFGVPPAGAILVWGSSVGGGYGDVAIAQPGSNVFTIKAFGQNYPYGTVSQFQNRNYNGLIGWGIPKTAVQPAPPAGGGRYQAIRNVNVRTAPGVNAPLTGSRILYTGQWFDAAGTVAGDNVGGNNVWVKSLRGNYVWSGNLKRIG